MNKRTQGYIAEDLVKEYLSNHGYRFRESNYTIRGGEIDLIMEDGDEVVFVEVKSLQSEKYIQLEESISNSKRRSLIRTAKIWLHKHKLDQVDWRIDFVGLVINKGEVERFVHYKNAIY